MIQCNDAPDFAHPWVHFQGRVCICSTILLQKPSQALLHAPAAPVGIRDNASAAVLEAHERPRPAVNPDVHDIEPVIAEILVLQKARLMQRMMLPVPVWGTSKLRAENRNARCRRALRLLHHDVERHNLVNGEIDLRIFLMRASRFRATGRPAADCRERRALDRADGILTVLERFHHRDGLSAHLWIPRSTRPSRNRPRIRGVLT